MPVTRLPASLIDRSAIFDPDLVARHDVSGPRYTSYPTAPQFRTDFGAAELRRMAHASNGDPIPRALSIYVHVPFCFSPCFYCGCNRVITRDTRRADVYLEHLAHEIALTAPLFDRDREVVQLHLGGGTPNFLDARQMTALMDALRSGFALGGGDGREFGIEVDPRYADAATIRMLAGLGFNRLSVGIQDFDPRVQQAVNRVQSEEQTRIVIDAAREHGFRSVSVDLILGLPRQTTERFARTLDAVLALAPDRIATYAYAHLPERFRAQRQIDATELPDAAARLALLGQCTRALGDAGYRYIGMDHFALPGDDLAVAQRAGTLHRNFQGYSTHADCDLVGLGVSSIGHVGRSFHQNARELPDYYAALDAGLLPVQRGLVLADEDLVRGDAIQRLMCHGRLDIAAFEHHHGIDFARSFPVELDRLRALADDGLVDVADDAIRVTARGRYLLRIVAMCFDAYLDAPDAASPRYSRAL
ncbi:oxygen-independent coproporphyrinogen III oxidase [Dokdonella sp. MW10]|uniref:oxygen-independent coproporphyrinogen III oxidase n=1 Tax=Dokdonella sp. MW10 TaxID=2992926 RepID=UPI003F7EB826